MFLKVLITFSKAGAASPVFEVATVTQSKSTKRSGPRSFTPEPDVYSCCNTPANVGKPSGGGPFEAEEEVRGLPAEGTKVRAAGAGEEVVVVARAARRGAPVSASVLQHAPAIVGKPSTCLSMPHPGKGYTYS